MSKATLKIGGCILAERPRRTRTDAKPSRSLMRLREIEKIIRARHGSVVPDPEDTDDRGTALAYVRAAAFSLAGQDINEWCRRWAPWVRPSEVLTIEAEARKRRHMIGADGVAAMLGITMEERTRIELKTIGACDVAKADRLKMAQVRKRERDRQQKAEKRKAAGTQDRNSYEGQSVARAAPWVAEGMSRRSWYRKRGTSPSRVDIYSNGDRPVPSDDGDAEAVTFPPPPKRDGSEAASLGVRGPRPRRSFQEVEPHGTGDTFYGEVA